LIAAQMKAPMKMEMVDCPPPRKRGGFLLIRMLGVTICGSDLHVYRGRQPHQGFPLPPGKPAHECVGRVVEEGGARSPSEGELVLVRPPEGDGLKELIAVPPDRLFQAEEFRLGLEEALMAQLLAPVVHCCRILGGIFGQRVFLLGQGPAGLTLTNMMRRMGASRIVTTDLVPERRRESLRRGADESLPPGGDLVAKARESNQGELFDLVIEAVGDQSTISMAPRLARSRGTVMFYGLPGQASLNPSEYFSKQLRLLTSEGPTERDFRQAMGMIARGDIDLVSMITHRLPFQEAPRGFALAESRKEGVLRVVLDLGD